MADSILLREQWMDKGWARGSFVDLKAHPELILLMPEKLQIKINENQQVFLIPILYDCALIEESFEKEPWAQVVLCCGCDIPDGNFKFGKNSRKIDFPIFIDGVETYQRIEAIGFCQLEREQLLLATPDKNVTWPDKGLEQLLNWISERYRQPTFPDEWNQRLAKQKKQLDKLCKNQAFINNCSGLYFDISPFSEIAEDDEYSINAFFVLSSTLTGKEHREFVKTHEAELIQKLTSIFKSTQNLAIGEIDMIKEDQFTKAMERNYKRWQLEHLSYKDLVNAQLPAELHIN
jgi:hypothetical protein